jgi:hypothetical protein
LLVCVGGPGEPLDEDVGMRATVDEDFVATPEGSAPWAFGVDVAVPPVVEGLELVRAGLGTPGSEPGSKAKSDRIAKMATPDATPIPFCSRRIFAFFMSYPHC